MNKKVMRHPCTVYTQYIHPHMRSIGLIHETLFAQSVPSLSLSLLSISLLSPSLLLLSVINLSMSLLSLSPSLLSLSVPSLSLSLLSLFLLSPSLLFWWREPHLQNFEELQMERVMAWNPLGCSPWPCELQKERPMARNLWARSHLILRAMTFIIFVSLKERLTFGPSLSNYGRE